MYNCENSLEWKVQLMFLNKSKCTTKGDHNWMLFKYFTYFFTQDHATTVFDFCEPNVFIFINVFVINRSSLCDRKFLKIDFIFCYKIGGQVILLRRKRDFIYCFFAGNLKWKIIWMNWKFKNKNLNFIKCCKILIKTCKRKTSNEKNPISYKAKCNNVWLIRC